MKHLHSPIRYGFSIAEARLLRFATANPEAGDKNVEADVAKSGAAAEGVTSKVLQEKLANNVQDLLNKLEASGTSDTKKNAVKDLQALLGPVGKDVEKLDKELQEIIHKAEVVIKAHTEGDADAPATMEAKGDVEKDTQLKKIAAVKEALEAAWKNVLPKDRTEARQNLYDNYMKDAKKFTDEINLERMDPTIKNKIKSAVIDNFCKTVEAFTADIAGLATELVKNKIRIEFKRKALELKKNTETPSPDTLEANKMRLKNLIAEESHLQTVGSVFGIMETEDYQKECLARLILVRKEMGTVKKTIEKMERKALLEKFNTARESLKNAWAKNTDKAGEFFTQAKYENLEGRCTELLKSASLEADITADAMKLIEDIKAFVATLEKGDVPDSKKITAANKKLNDAWNKMTKDAAPSEKLKSQFDELVNRYMKFISEKTFTIKEGEKYIADVDAFVEKLIGGFDVKEIKDPGSMAKINGAEKKLTAVKKIIDELPGDFSGMKTAEVYESLLKECGDLRGEAAKSIITAKADDLVRRVNEFLAGLEAGEKEKEDGERLKLTKRVTDAQAALKTAWDLPTTEKTPERKAFYDTYTANAAELLEAIANRAIKVPEITISVDAYCKLVDAFIKALKEKLKDKDPETEKKIRECRERANKVAEKIRSFATQSDRDSRVADRMLANVEESLTLLGKEPAREKELLPKANEFIADAEKMYTTEEGWEKNKWKTLIEKEENKWMTLPGNVGKPGFVYKWKTEGGKKQVYAYSPALGAEFLQSMNIETNQWTFITDAKTRDAIIKTVPANGQEMIKNGEEARLAEIYSTALVQKSMDEWLKKLKNNTKFQVAHNADGNVASVECTIGNDGVDKNVRVSFPLPGHKNGGPVDYPPVEELARRIQYAYDTGKTMLDSEQTQKLGYLRRSEGLMSKGSGAMSGYGFQLDGRKPYVDVDGTKRWIDTKNPVWGFTNKDKAQDLPWAKEEKEKSAPEKALDASIAKINALLLAKGINDATVKRDGDTVVCKMKNGATLTVKKKNEKVIGISYTTKEGVIKSLDSAVATNLTDLQNKIATAFAAIAEGKEKEAPLQKIKDAYIKYGVPENAYLRNCYMMMIYSPEVWANTEGINSLIQFINDFARDSASISSWMESALKDIPQTVKDAHPEFTNAKEFLEKVTPVLKKQVETIRKLDESFDKKVWNKDVELRKNSWPLPEGTPDKNAEAVSALNDKAKLQNIINDAQTFKEAAALWMKDYTEAGSPKDSVLLMEVRLQATMLKRFEDMAKWAQDRIDTIDGKKKDPDKEKEKVVKKKFEEMLDKAEVPSSLYGTILVTSTELPKENLTGVRFGSGEVSVPDYHIKPDISEMEMRKFVNEIKEKGTAWKDACKELKNIRDITMAPVRVHKKTRTNPTDVLPAMRRLAKVLDKGAHPGEYFGATFAFVDGKDAVRITEKNEDKTETVLHRIGLEASEAEILKLLKGPKKEKEEPKKNMEKILSDLNKDIAPKLTNEIDIILKARKFNIVEPTAKFSLDGENIFVDYEFTEQVAPRGKRYSWSQKVLSPDPKFDVETIAKWAKDAANEFHLKYTGNKFEEKKEDKEEIDLKKPAEQLWKDLKKLSVQNIDADAEKIQKIVAALNKALKPGELLMPPCILFTNARPFKGIFFDHAKKTYEFRPMKSDTRPDFEYFPFPEHIPGRNSKSVNDVMGAFIAKNPASQDGVTLMEKKQDLSVDKSPAAARFCFQVQHEGKTEHWYISRFMHAEFSDTNSAERAEGRFLLTREDPEGGESVSTWVSAQAIFDARGIRSGKGSHVREENAILESIALKPNWGTEIKKRMERARKERTLEKDDAAGVRTFDLPKDGTLGYLDFRQQNKDLNGYLEENYDKSLNGAGYKLTYTGQKIVDGSKAPIDQLKEALTEAKTAGVKHLFINMHTHGSDGLAFSTERGYSRMTWDAVMNLLKEEAFKDMHCTIKTIACYGGWKGAAPDALSDDPKRLDQKNTMKDHASAPKGRVTIMTQTKPYEYNQFRTYNQYFRMFVEEGLSIGEAHIMADRMHNHIWGNNAEIWRSSKEGGIYTAKNEQKKNPLDTDATAAG